MGKGLIKLVVGGQFGSEAKGLYVEKEAKKGHIKVHVRTGAINAGHTVYLTRGGKRQRLVFQTLPCGSIDPCATLVIGAGAYVEPDHLAKEIEMVDGLYGAGSTGQRLVIDFKSGHHSQADVEEEVGAGMHARMGSTAHGCMAASVRKMRRLNEYQQFSQTARGQEMAKVYGFTFGDASKLLNATYDEGGEVMLEGTQGTGLDFFHGTYPYNTSRSTIAANWMAEAGLSPRLKSEVALICRAYPIRVAGNSGPFNNEVEWLDLARTVNAKREALNMPPVVDEGILKEYERQCIDLAGTLGLPSHKPSEWTEKQRFDFKEQLSGFHQNVFKRMSDSTVEELKGFFEITTVTKKLRRIAKPDWDLLRKSVQLNRPDFIVLNFLNYEFPNVEACKKLRDLKSLPNWMEVAAYVNEWEMQTGVKVKYVGTSRFNLIRL